MTRAERIASHALRTGNTAVRMTARGEKLLKRGNYGVPTTGMLVGIADGRLRVRLADHVTPRLYNELLWENDR